MFPRGQIAAMLPLHADRDSQQADAPRRLEDSTAQPRATVRIRIVELGDLPAAVLSPGAAT